MNPPAPDRPAPKPPPPDGGAALGASVPSTEPPTIETASPPPKPRPESNLAQPHREERPRPRNDSCKQRRGISQSSWVDATPKSRATSGLVRTVERGLSPRTGQALGTGAWKCSEASQSSRSGAVHSSGFHGQHPRCCPWRTLSSRQRCNQHRRRGCDQAGPRLERCFKHLSWSLWKSHSWRQRTPRCSCPGSRRSFGISHLKFHRCQSCRIHASWDWLVHWRRIRQRGVPFVSGSICRERIKEGGKSDCLSALGAHGILDDADYIITECTRTRVWGYVVPGWDRNCGFCGVISDWIIAETVDGIFQTNTCTIPDLGETTRILGEEVDAAVGPEVLEVDPASEQRTFSFQVALRAWSFDRSCRLSIA